MKNSDFEVKDNQIVNRKYDPKHIIIISWNEYAICKCKFILIDIPMHNLLTEYSVIVHTVMSHIGKILQSVSQMSVNFTKCMYYFSFGIVLILIMIINSNSSSATVLGQQPLLS
jgi:hypothetical protein